jgi:hypothetical protein
MNLSNIKLPEFGSDRWWRFYQPVILGLLNNPIPRIREHFRDQIVCCDHLDPKIKIAKIDGRSVHYQVDKDIRAANFYTLKANDNHIRKNYERVLMPLHNWDLRISRVPILKTAFDLGFSTLTAYSSTADGQVYNNTSATWATVHDATTGTVYNNTGSYGGSAAGGVSWNGSVHEIDRNYYYFNTSSMGSGKAISSAIFSLRGYSNNSANVSVQQGTQAATLGTGDFDNFTNTYFAKTTSWSTAGYNDMTLDSSGKTWCNNNSLCYMCTREYDHDYLNSHTDSNYSSGAYYADAAGTSVDPKLVITYSVAATSKIKTINGINQANIKTADGLAVANLKSFNGILNQ